MLTVNVPSPQALTTPSLPLALSSTRQLQFIGFRHVSSHVPAVSLPCLPSFLEPACLLNQFSCQSFLVKQSSTPVFMLTLSTMSLQSPRC